MLLAKPGLVALLVTHRGEHVQRRVLSTSIQQIRQRNALVRFDGKRAVVVGGTSGIGEAVAKRLARAQVSVTIVGRSSRGHDIVRELQQLGGNGHEFLPCDSFLMNNIKSLSAELTHKYPKIDYLVMTQGMATVQGRTETAEGLDQKLALHYFGRMCFTQQLLPSLRASGSGKVLSVLSGGVHKSYAQYREDFELRTHYSLQNAADSAGYYNDLGLDGLSRQPENANLLFLHASPGFVSTNWGTEMPALLRVAVRLIQRFAKSADDAAEAMASPLFEMNETGFCALDEFGNKTKLTSEHSDSAVKLVLSNTLNLLERILVDKH